MEKTPKFKVGDNVKNFTTNKIGTINAVTKSDRGYSYRVTIDGKTRTVPEEFLEIVPDTEQNVIENYHKGIIGDYPDYKLFQTWYRLSRPIETNIYSYLGSKTIFNPHQFKPLMKFLSHNSDERLFIADEVGVGKTIESGIILKELIARERLDQTNPILIVCPNSLTRKWQMEMQDRFMLDFEIIDGEKLQFILRITLQDGFYPKKYLRSIVGLQLSRRTEYVDLLEKIDNKRDVPLFGLVIIDEAHHMRNPETDSNRLGNTLSQMSDMLLMLSATPLNLHSGDLYNQMHILNPTLFPEQSAFETMYDPLVKINRIRNLLHTPAEDSIKKIQGLFKELRTDSFGNHLLQHPDIIPFVERLDRNIPLSAGELVKFDHVLVELNPLFYSFNRTRKREAFEHQVRREVIELAIVLTPEELALQERILTAVIANHLKKSPDSPMIGFITNIYRRMISSCLPAAFDYVRWAVDNDQITTITSSSALEDMEDDAEFSSENLDESQKRMFVDILEQSKRIRSVDSKYSQFQILLDKITANNEFKQVIIFSFFIRTLEYLKDRLVADGYKVGIIHGDIPTESKDGISGRYEIIDAFRKGKFDILLSSEVGGEGLDFQFCRVMINYDLPYNPMRVEQRIGRIDRFGQNADKIFIANLFIKDTVDEEIYDRLYRRIRLVEEGVGALEPVMGKQIADLQTAIITGSLSDHEKEELTRRLELAIENAKIEAENFETLRYSLACDDYLSQPGNTILNSDFITIADAMAITEYYLKAMDGCSFTQIGDYCCEISLSDTVIEHLESFLRRPKNEYAYRELAQITDTPKSIKIIFDGKNADQYPNYIFLNPAGPWSRFLAHEISAMNKLYNNFEISVVKSSELQLLPDDYTLFLFEVALEGLKTEIQLIGIPISNTDKKIIQLDIEKIPRLFGNLKPVECHYSSRTDTVLFDELFEIARSHLELIFDEKRKRLSTEISFKLDGLITGLKQSSGKKVEKLQQSLSSHIDNRMREGKKPDENYIRLTEGKINRENIRLETRITELNKKRDSSLNYSLEAIVHLHSE